MSHYSDWETMEGISSVKDCGSSGKFCMKMRRLKKKEGGTVWKDVWSSLGEGKGCAEVVMGVERWEEKFFCKVEIVYI